VRAWPTASSSTRRSAPSETPSTVALGTAAVAEVPQRARQTAAARATARAGDTFIKPASPEIDSRWIGLSPIPASHLTARQLSCSLSSRNAAKTGTVVLQGRRRAGQALRLLGPERGGVAILATPARERAEPRSAAAGGWGWSGRFAGVRPRHRPRTAPNRCRCLPRRQIPAARAEKR
jgi:hypothetical protein